MLGIKIMILVLFDKILVLFDKILVLFDKILVLFDKILVLFDRNIRISLLRTRAYINFLPLQPLPPCNTT